MEFIERLLADAADRGDFDHLPGSGRPLRIADAEPGWWGRREAARIRSGDRARAVLDDVEKQLGAVWMLADADAVRGRVDELNRVLTEAGLEDALLDAEATVATWKRMARMRLRPSGR